MGNSNGVITAPVSLHADVYPVLGISKVGDFYDVGYACSNVHGKINKWSLYKPVFYKSNQNLVKIDGNNRGDSGFAPEYAGASNLVYAKKLESDNLFYDLSHFDGYDHKTPNPFDVSDISYIGLGQASTGTYTYTARVPITGIIKTIMKEGLFGLLGKWTDEDDQSLSGETAYYDYAAIKDKDSVDVAIKIDWSPSSHKDFYIREYKFYLSTPAHKTFTVEGYAITGRFGCILSAPTVQVEWVQFDGKFNNGTQEVIFVFEYKTKFRAKYKTSDAMPTQAYVDTLNNKGVIKVEYKTSQTQKEWEQLYYGLIPNDSLSFFYRSGSGDLYVELELYHPGVSISSSQAENSYFRITRLQDEEK